MDEEVAVTLEMESYKPASPLVTLQSEPSEDPVTVAAMDQTTTQTTIVERMAEPKARQQELGEQPLRSAPKEGGERQQPGWRPWQQQTTPF